MKILIWNFQGRLLRVKEHHSWCQEWPCHPCLQSGTVNILKVPHSWNPLPDTLLSEISTQNFHGIFHRVKTSFMISGMTLSSMFLIRNPHCLPSTPFLIPPSWHTSNYDINMKISGYLPWGISRSSINCMGIGLKDQVLGWRSTHQPSAGARIRGAAPPYFSFLKKMTSIGLINIHLK